MTAFRFFTVLSLAAVLNFEGLAAPGFTMRLDDNRSPEQWNRIAGIFERQGMRCSFAVIPATLSEAQGACLKDLARRGHLIMDHTPNHSFYTASYAEQGEFERARRLPFAAESDEGTRTVRFRCETDGNCPKNRRLRASIKGDVIRFGGGSSRIRTLYAFIGIPGKTAVYGLQASDGGIKLRDFWRRPLKEQLDFDDVEVVLYDQAALQPCDDLLRELARISRERFDHFGLPRPTVWVRPGGWDPGVAWDRIEQIYGREFGYVGADSGVGEGAHPGGSRWTTGRDAMQFFDQGPNVSPEGLVDMIEKSVRSGRCYVILSHMWCNRLAGGFEEYCRKTEAFARLLVERKIPVLTMEESLRERFKD